MAQPGALAVHLIHDGHLGAYEVAVLITSDSDLAEAVRIVRHDLGLPVGIQCPCRRPSIVLKRALDYRPKARHSTDGRGNDVEVPSGA